MEKEQLELDEKLDKILKNQQIIFSMLLQIQKDVNSSRFVEDYSANLAAVWTETLLFGKNKR